MTSKRKHRVIRGNNHLTVYRWKHPQTGAERWRFAWKDGGKWRYQTHLTKADAEEAARKILDEQADGLVWSGLDGESRRFLEEVHRRTLPGDRGDVLAFLRARDRSGEIGEAVQRFIAAKVSEAGEKTPHLRTVERVLDSVVEKFRGRRVVDIHFPELADWWKERGEGLGSKRRKDLRAAVSMFWRWCLRQGIAGSEPVTVAERLPNVKAESGDKHVFTPAELLSILHHVARPWRAWVVLGAFAGLRPEEIAPPPTKKKAKRGLRCEEIDWQFKVLRVPAVVSKVNRPRIVPMSDALIAGLRWAGISPGHSGPIVLKNAAKKGETKRLGKLLFGTDWPHNALRHSFGSYRNAIVRNLAQVAEEMGTSEAMLHKHYHNPRAEEEGKEWFAIRFDPMRIESQPGNSQSKPAKHRETPSKTA